MGSSAFKTCPLCHQSWGSLEDFLRDPEVIIEGYQASFVDPLMGLFLFTHNTNNCGTTISLRVHYLQYLVSRTDKLAVLRDTDACSTYCMDPYNLEPCPAPCAMSWIRVVLQMLRTRHFPKDLNHRLALGMEGPTPLPPLHR